MWGLWEDVCILPLSPSLIRVWPLGQEDSLAKEWLSTPVFLPGESQGQSNLVGYSPWGCKELSRTEQLTLFSITYYSHPLGQIIWSLGALVPPVRWKSFLHEIFVRLKSTHLRYLVSGISAAKKRKNVHCGLHIAVAVVESPSCVRLFVTPRTVASQAALSLGFSRQEY